MEIKKCSSCEVEKSLRYFGKDSSRKDGLKYKCVNCDKKYAKINYTKYKEKHNHYMKEWYQKNKDAHSENSKNWRENNPKRFREIQGKYKENNIEKIREYSNNYKKQKRKTDLNYKIKVNLRERMRDCLKNNYKKGKALELLGCSVNEYVIYLEQQFDESMNWENYGTYWEIDHIKQLHTFDLTQTYNHSKAFNYKNTRPLTITKNRQRKKYE